MSFGGLQILRAACVATVLLSAIAGAAIGAASASPGLAQTHVPCGQAIAERTAPDARNVVTLRRVALAPRPPLVLGPGYNPSDNRWPYSLKHGLQIRRGTASVTISVPRKWYDAARITFGYGVQWTTEVVFDGCMATLNPWLAYSGGIEVARKACVPLTITIGDRSTVVRMPLGKPCSR